MSRTRKSFLALATSAFTPFTFADEVQLERVQVTASRTPAGQYSVPQPVTVLDADELAAQSPQVMTERLRGAPGAYFQQTGAGQGVAIVRGLKGAEVLHLVDGFRLNNAFFRTAPSQYIALVDPYNIGQLELLRGPYATLYGSDAMGGVLQVLTPEERFTPGADVAVRNQISLGYTTADEGFHTRVRQAVGTDTFSVAAGFTLQDYGERAVGGTAQRADGRGGVTFGREASPTAYTARGYDVKALWKPARGHQLMANASYFDLPSLPRYNEVVRGFGAAPAVRESNYFNDRTFYHLRYRMTAPLAFLESAELHVGRQLVTDDRLDVSLDGVTRTFEGNRSTLDGVTAQLVSALGSSNTLTYGAEFYRDRVRSNKLVSTNDGAFVISGPGSPNAVKARFPDNSHTTNVGAYLSDKWTPTERAVLDAGVRYNRTKTTLALADRLEGGTVESDDVTGQLGALYRLTRALSLTANAGRAFRAPNINDLAQTGRRSGSPPRITTSNTELDPETITSGDLGLKWFGGGLEAELSAFYSKYDDRITTLPTGRSIAPGTEGCPSGTTACIEVQNVNIAKASYYGVESGLRYTLNRQLSARVTLNYTHAEQEIDGDETPGNRTPPLNGLVAIGWQPLPVLLIEPSVYFNDRQDRLDAVDLADNRINPDGTGGFTVLNLRTVWQPTPVWRVQLAGENLLDKSYREHGSGIDGRGAGASLTVSADFR